MFKCRKGKITNSVSDQVRRKTHKQMKTTLARVLEGKKADEAISADLMNIASDGAAAITAEEEEFCKDLRGTTSIAGANLYAPRMNKGLFGHAHVHFVMCIDDADGYHHQRDELLELLGIKHDQNYCDDR